MADTVAQQITMARSRSTNDQLHTNKDIADLTQSQRSDPSFDYPRLSRFVGYGLMMTPIQLKWFTLLSRWFPLESKRPTLSAVKRVTCDQVVFAPMGMYFMNLPCYRPMSFWAETDVCGRLS